MAAHRFATRFCITLLLLSCAISAATAQTTRIDPGSDWTGDRVERHEFTDSNGNQFEIETHTDAMGRRWRVTRPVAAPVGVADRAGFEGRASLASPPETGGTMAGPTWQSIGPDGGDVGSIAISPLDPSIMLAGISNREGLYILPRTGIYRSNDSGRTWHPADLLEAGGRARVHVNLIRFAPDGSAYAASSAGIWRSGDQGATWHRLPGDSFRPSTRVVAIEPGDPRHLWIGLLYGGGIRRSLDGGATWQAVPIPGVLTDADCNGIAFDPARPGVVFACFGTYTEGQVWASFDGGASWVNRSAGVPNSRLNDIVYDGSRWLLCGGAYAYLENDVGLLASSDDGVSWTRLTAAWPIRIFRDARDVEVDPGNPCVIWLAGPQGLYRSVDCGAHWTFGVAGANQNAFCVVVGPGGNVYGGMENYGVLRRPVTGPFEPWSHGIRELQVTSVDGNPTDPRELAATFAGNNQGGLFTSRDGGESWQLDPAFQARMSIVRFDHSGNLYAVSDGPSDLGAEGLYRRKDNGTWSKLGPDQGRLYETELFWLQVSPHDPQLILTGGGDFSDHGFALAVWRSTDGGITWSKVIRHATYGFSLPDGVLLDDGSDQVALVALPVMDGPSVMRSEDRGATWSPAMSGLTPGGFVTALATSPRDPNLVFAGGIYGPAGFHRSTDGGRTWQATSYDKQVYRLLCDPGDARGIYALGSYYQPLLRSSDGGDSFSPVDVGGEPLPQGTWMSILPGPCPRLLLASVGGVFARDLDTTPPRLEVRPDPETLWPPDHEMVAVHADVTLSDDCDSAPTFVLTSITCNEPDAEADIVGAELGQPDTDFQLRATREGYGAGRIYSITYTATDADGNSAQVVRTVRVPHDRSAAMQDSGLPAPAGAFGPAATRLQRVSPSPFQAGTWIAFDLAEPAPVSVRIFDVRGAAVRTLLDGFRPVGRYRLEWDGRDASGNSLPGGMYWVRFETPDHRQTIRVARLR